MAIITGLPTATSGTIRCAVASETYMYTSGNSYLPWEDFGSLGTNLFIKSGTRTIQMKNSGAKLVLTWVRSANYNLDVGGGETITIEVQTISYIGYIGDVVIWSGSADCYEYLSFGFYTDGDYSYAIHVNDFRVAYNKAYVEKLSYPIVYGGSAEQTKSGLTRWLQGVGKTDPYSDPYKHPTGGNGDHIREGDIIEIPDNPELTAINSGLITAYSPSMGQLQEFGHYLWSTEWDIDALKKIFNDPWQGIMGLSVVPVQPSTGANRLIHLGNLETSVSAPRITNQFASVNCGSVTIDGYYDTYLDYSPYSSIEIYLPYIGVKPLDIDTVMGKTISVNYKVDVLSGACVCYVSVSGSVVYQYSGQCAGQIPLTANNFSSVISSALSAAASAIGTGISVASGNVAGAISGVAGTASSVMSAKEKVEKGGAVSGYAGLMAVQYPYIIYTFPDACVPDNQNSFIGYPAYKTVALGSLSGYTEVDTIHLENVHATSAELDEIERLLKEGVIL